MQNKFIYVPTVRHSGTWFLIAFLRSHPIVQGFVQLENLFTSNFDKEHTVVFDCPTAKIKERFTPGGLNVLHNHVCFSTRIASSVVDAQKGLMASLPSIVPFRDPLASIVSRYQRHPNQCHLGLAQSWVTFIEFLVSSSSVLNYRAVPLDILKSETERRDALEGVLDHAEIPAKGHAAEWASQWPLGYNTRGNYALKARYNAGDVEYIQRTVHEEFKYLQNRRRIVQPFLESLGYRDLMWWF